MGGGELLCLMTLQEKKGKFGSEAKCFDVTAESTRVEPWLVVIREGEA